jgi:hypothetical protein
MSFVRLARTGSRAQTPTCDAESSALEVIERWTPLCLPKVLMANSRPPVDGVATRPVQGRAAMTLKRLTVLVLVSFVLQGCATIGPIEVSGDPASLPPFRTFRVHEEQFAFATEISAEQRARISKELRQAAVSALNQRGYVEASDADVLVTLGAISRPTLHVETESGGGRIKPVDTSVFDAGQPPGVPESDRMPSGEGREGDLILYLLDPKTQRAVWRASSNGSATTPSEALRRARATYAAMVAKLPGPAVDAR